MNLPFKTSFNGKPTYIVEKIWAGFTDPRFHLMDSEVWPMHLAYCITSEKIDQDVLHDFQQNRVKKIHAIIADNKKRWREGMDIHMIINNNMRTRFQFALPVRVKSIQKIEISHRGVANIFVVKIDRRLFAICDYECGDYFNEPGLNKLARQDGFDSIEDFMAFFPNDFSGIIIHWTDERYI